MTAVLVAASNSRIIFSIYLALRARCVRVPDGSKSHLEPGTIMLNIYSIRILVVHIYGIEPMSSMLLSQGNTL